MQISEQPWSRTREHNLLVDSPANQRYGKDAHRKYVNQDGTAYETFLL